MAALPFSLNNLSYSVPAPQFWDVVLTCFEPLVKVTGGIGTYHRLLLRELSDAGVAVLVLTRSDDLPEPMPGVSIIDVKQFVPDRPFNFVGLEHDHFSLQCHFALRALYREGHRFGLIEFSDYGADGFYPLRARASGAYEFGTAAVRLHSPEVMLIEDNGGRHSALSVYIRDRIDREMSVYEDADVILYGGDAMRDRIVNLTSKFGLDIAAKMVKCPHPYPRELFKSAQLAGVGVDRLGEARRAVIGKVSESQYVLGSDLDDAIFIGVTGRIEDRKGQYQLFDALLRDPEFVSWLEESRVHFVICGHSVLDHIGNYRLNDLYGLIHSRGLQARFHFLGRLVQEDLAQMAPAMAAHVFPSVFENYPNALLEVLPLCTPVVVSAHGCMPEMVQGFAHAHVFDPLKLNVPAFIGIMKAVTIARSGADTDELERRIATLEGRQNEMRRFYAAPIQAAQSDRPGNDARVGVVIPVYEDHAHLEETLASVAAALRPGDRIIVVDDGSGPDNAAGIRDTVQRAGAELLLLPVNAGPAAARRAGVGVLDTELVQLCDADDLIPLDALERLREMFARDPLLDMATGTMACFGDAEHCWVPRNGQLWTAIQDNFSHSGVMCRRESLGRVLAVEHPPMLINEDWLMNLLFIALGGKCRMTPEITYHYRRHPGTRSTMNQSTERHAHGISMDALTEQLTFSNPQTTSRLRIMLRASLGVPSASGGGGGLLQQPLRYKLADAMFHRIRRHERLMPLVERIRKMLVRKGWV